jgi:hypothetical protein
MTSGDQDKRTAVDLCIIVPYFPEKKSGTNVKNTDCPVSESAKIQTNSKRAI